MVTSNIPKRLWCYGIEHQAKMMQFISQGKEELFGYEHITGKTPDISEYCEFDFYYLVWYWTKKHALLTKNHIEQAR